MSGFVHTMGGLVWRFDSLRELLAKASPARSGDVLAQLAASSDAERAAAQMTLAEVPLKHFLDETVIDYERDEITRLIIDTHDAGAFAAVSHLTVGGLRDWLLGDEADEQSLRALAPGLTPEMAAAVSKIMRIQDLILVAQKIRVVTRFRNTQGLRGRLSTRLQPNHPTDDPAGIAASLFDGLLYGNGDAMLGINPATDSLSAISELLKMLDEVIQRYEIPTQSCVLTHVTSSIAAIERGLPLDLVFQSIAGTEAANASFGVSLALLREGYDAGSSLKRGPLGQRAPRGRPADLRSTGLWRRPAFQAVPGQHRRGLHRSGVSVQRQADHPCRPGRPLLRQAAGCAHGLRHLLHQSRRGRPG
jgi:ethanolamine ammonia-lyase large subunit